MRRSHDRPALRPSAPTVSPLANRPDLPPDRVLGLPGRRSRHVGTVGCQVSRVNGIQPSPRLRSRRKSWKPPTKTSSSSATSRRLDDLWTVGAAAIYRRPDLGFERHHPRQFVVNCCDQRGYDQRCLRRPLNGRGSTSCSTRAIDISTLQRSLLPQRPVGEPRRPTGGYTDTAPASVRFRRTPALTDYETLITLSRPTCAIRSRNVNTSALEFSFEREFDGVWGLQGSYDASKSEGNYEGTVLSDVGQADAGSTQPVRLPVVLRRLQPVGLLPNHHAHQFKVFGYYQVFDELHCRRQPSVISPQPLRLPGFHPTCDGDGHVPTVRPAALLRPAPIRA